LREQVVVSLGVNIIPVRILASAIVRRGLKDELSLFGKSLDYTVLKATGHKLILYFRQDFKVHKQKWRRIQPWVWSLEDVRSLYVVTCNTQSSKCRC
jgi:hypothetical protein